MQRISTADSIDQHPLKGALVETFVFLELFKKLQSWNSKPQLYHFRTYAGAKVDLILEQDGVLYPIEIKSSSHPKPSQLKEFQSFKATFPKENIGPATVICASEEIKKLTDDITAVPWWLV